VGIEGLGLFPVRKGEVVVTATFSGLHLFELPDGTRVELGLRRDESTIIPAGLRPLRRGVRFLPSAEYGRLPYRSRLR
jgi:hypothetical protein